MVSIRLLHLSDMHISDLAFCTKKDILKQNADGDSNYHRNYELIGQEYIIEAIAQWCNDNRDEFDAILITGDLVDQARYCDLKLAKSFIEDFPSENPYLTTKNSAVPTQYPTIFSDGKPILLMPGNHDRLHPLVIKPKICLDRFEKIFPLFWGLDCSPGVKSVFLPSPQNPLLCIVCADFSLRKSSQASLRFGVRFGVWGQGIVDPVRLRLLEDHTIDSQNRSIPVAWALHFAPLYPKQKMLEKLRESEKLIELAEALKISVILCGHTHKKQKYFLGPKKVPVYCGGTSGCIKIGSWDTSICIHDFSLDGPRITDIKHNEYFWDEDANTFLMPVR